MLLKKKSEIFCENKTRLLKLICILSIFGFCFISAFFFFYPNKVNAQLLNQNLLKPDYQLMQLKSPDVKFENNKVYIGLWIIDIYDFDYRSRYYTLDMYISFFWTDPNIDTVDWYLRNGYPVDPLDVKLANSGIIDNANYEFYRIPARLFTPPVTSVDYPLDQIKLEISIELLTGDYDASLVWLKNYSGVDPEFKNPGWNTVAVELVDMVHVYPLDAESTGVEMIITQERAVSMGVFFFTVVPPILFVVLSSVSFLFIPKTLGLIGTRIGLISSILIADILFNFTVISLIPPLETISKYGILLACVLIFIVLNLIITMVGLAVFLRYNSGKYARRINLWGFLISSIVPCVLFIIIVFFA